VESGGVYSAVVASKGGGEAAKSSSIPVSPG